VCARAVNGIKVVCGDSTLSRLGFAKFLNCAIYVAVLVRSRTASRLAMELAALRVDCLSINPKFNITQNPAHLLHVQSYGIKVGYGAGGPSAQTIRPGDPAPAKTSSCC
jgi:hypothetical protein